MKNLIDLHVHSNYSDGTLTPTELVALANKKQLRAFALTDHDTTDGILDAFQAAKESGTGIEIIPGIELSTVYKKKDIHIVGLGININDCYFQDNLKQFQSARDVRNYKMIEKLQDKGISITIESMFEQFGDIVLTRAHFARYLQDRGYVSNMHDAFPKYIGDDAPCYVPKERVTPYQAIQLIHSSGGKAILAHPLLYNLSTEELDILIASLSKAGLDGLEVYYSQNRYGDEQKMKMIASKYNLKLSGGSDFHGSNKPNIQLGTGKGNVNMEYSIWKNLWLS
ncbi:MAG: PHP domain-containing protein [Eubacteriales bacterium]